MMRTTAVALAALLILVPAATVSASQRVERASYHLAAPGPFASVEGPPVAGLPDGDGVHLGGKTFAIASVETNVEVFLLDATGKDVPGRAGFYDADGRLVGTKSFCFEADLAIPSGAVEVTIFPAATFVTPEALLSPCGFDPLRYGPPTTGDIVVAFR